jgi:hypothetical protein
VRGRRKLEDRYESLLRRDEIAGAGGGLIIPVTKAVDIPLLTKRTIGNNIQTGTYLIWSIGDTNVEIR